MKKILSLFISIIIVSSMVFGCFSSAVFAADEKQKLAKELLDMTGNKLAISGTVARFGYGNSSKGETNTAVNETLFGKKVILINALANYTNDNNDTRLQISTASGINSGKVRLSYGLYLAATSDGTLSFRARRTGNTAPVINIDLKELNLVPYRWYEIVIEIDLEKTSDNCTVKAIDENGSLYASKTVGFDFKTSSYSLGNMFLWGTPRTDAKPAGAPSHLSGEIAYYAIRDIYISHEDGTEKVKILSVGSAGEVAHSQNKISFKLSQKLDTLLPNHILIKNKANLSDTISISSIDNVQSDGGGYVVNATLGRSLAPWTDYYLEISGSVYSGYKEVKSDGLYDIIPVGKGFHTPSAPFDIKDPDFSYNGSVLKADTKMINTTGAKDVCFVLASYSHRGKVKAIVQKAYPAFEAVYPGSDADISIPAEDGDIIRFFVIDNMQNKKALFGKSWTVNYDGTPAEAFVSSAGNNKTPGTIKLGDFDYDKKKITADIKNITSDAANGILTVYSDASRPVFADFITTKSDGSYLKEISFADSFPYGTYTVEFTLEDMTSLKSSFTYYTPEEIKENTRRDILTLAKQAPNSGTLMNVILGINENGEKINNNFDVFKADAKSEFYDLVKNKDEVFALMKQNMSQAGTYSELISLFNSSAQSRYNTENNAVINPSVNNNNYGPSNTVVTENRGSSSPAVSGGAMPAAPSAPQASFVDTKGHWAEKFMEDLSKKGIINGYNDGTFRPENHITRAELAKLLTGAFGQSEDSFADFSDVAPDSWYYKSIAAALADGIVTGYDDGSFKPDAFVTRQDAVLMMYRAMSLKKELPSGYTLFKDDFEISSYAANATRCLGELGIITGNEDKEFKPQNNITRAEIAAVVCRGLDYLQSH